MFYGEHNLPRFTRVERNTRRAGFGGCSCGNPAAPRGKVLRELTLLGKTSSSRNRVSA
jgi:hypothetical protein